ncbi:hypothetical protein B0H21DRAFT_762027 [Amylocystis lapponica]|nr:hypothetical protein B0H21DRAFT_762027 [Amylocystis lapponica]
MHCCLQILEIITVVIRLVEDEEEEYHSHLASIARTCRAFHELALDRLWYYQFNIYNLVKCMPSDAWGTRPGTNSSGDVLFLKRILRADDWTRFRAYAKRIRCLDTMGRDTVEDVFDHSKRSEIHEDVYNQLNLYRTSGSLLPNLEILRISDAERSFYFTQLFLGPRLAFIDLKTTPGDHRST